IRQNDIVKISGPSVDGGSILCNGCLIDTHSDHPTQPRNGGNILLAAYRGQTGASGGNITLTGTNGGTVRSDGTNDGDNDAQAGNITIIAPGDITIGDVSILGDLGSPKMTVTTAQPVGKLIAGFFGTTSGAISPGTVVAGEGTITLAAN